MRRVRWKRKNVRDELAAGGQLTHTKERPVRTADKIQKSPASCADRCSLNNCILASAGMAFIWLQRGHHLLLFPLPLSILWGWFPKAGAEAPGLCVVGGSGRIETPWCFSSGVWGGFFSRKECAPRPCSGNYPLREQREYPPGLFPLWFPYLPPRQSNSQQLIQPLS